MSNTVSNIERYLTFSLGTEDFAIPLLKVKEVIALTEVTPLPQTPPYFLGIMNLRGQVITVLDLRTKLGIKPAKNQETVVVICDLGTLCVGVVVDSVNSVVPVSEDKISPKPDMTGAKSDSIIGVYQDEKNLVLLLDISKTLNLTDHATVQKGSEQNKQAAKAA